MARRRTNLSLCAISPILAFVVTIIGGVTGVFPDVSPELARLFPYKKLAMAIDELGKLEHTDNQGNNYGLVEVSGIGHGELFEFLREIDPTVPSLEKILQSASHSLAGGIVSTSGGVKIGYGGGEIPVNLHIAVVLSTGELKPICAISELTWRVQERINRLWSQVGLVFVVLGAIIALIQSKPKPFPS